MKILLATLMLSATLFSCGKSGSHEPDLAQTYPVTLEVSNFTQTIDDFNNSARSRSAVKSERPSLVKSAIPTDENLKPLAERINGLRYSFYNLNGDYIIHQDRTNKDDDFGTITQNLPLGVNHVIVTGFQNITENDGYLNNINDETNIVAHENGDFFGKRELLDIKPNGSKQSIVLRREVGLLQLTVEDAIPENIKDYELTVYNICKTQNIFNPESSETVKTASSSFTYAEGDSKEAGHIFDIYSFCPNVANMITCSISFSYTLKDDPDFITYYRDVADIKIYKNKITSVKGKVFSTDQDFDITIQDQWTVGDEVNF